MVTTERVRRGRLRRVSKILETRGNFDEVSEIKKSTIFIETSRQKKFSVTTKFFVIESSSKSRKSKQATEKNKIYATTILLEDKEG